MTSVTILRIESAPGDAPRAVEQPNGDLLLPAATRSLIEQILLKTESTMATDRRAAVTSLKEASRLLGIEKKPEEPAVVRNLLKVRPI